MRRLAPAVALAAAHLASADARAFVRSASQSNPQACLFWLTRQPSFTLNAAGSVDAGADASLQAARKSFATWTTPVCTDLTFADKGTTQSSKTGNDQTNIVVWREKTCASAAPSSDPCFASGGCNNLYNCWEGTDSTIALTTVLYNSRTGEIADADIELNGAGFVFTTLDSPPCTVNPPRPADCVATDVQNTLTHGIGHFIGLDHSLVAGATMNATAALGETVKRALHQDDINGLCTIYPRGLPVAACVPLGSDVSGSGCGCGAAGGAPTLLLLAPLALALRPRRLRPGTPRPSAERADREGGARG